MSRLPVRQARRPIASRLPRLAATGLLLLLGPISCDRGPPGSGDAPSFTPVKWELPAEPVFSISEGTDDTTFQFFRAWSGVIVDDETLAIGNQGTREVILLDFEGNALRIVGGEGEGPGEFASIRELFSVAGGFGVWDSSLRRFTTFSTAGEFVGSTSLSGAGSGIVYGRLASGGLVSASGFEPRVPRRIQVWDDEGAALAEIAGPLGPPASLVSWNVGEGSRTTSIPMACVPGTAEAVVGDAIYALDHGIALLEYDRSGARREVYRTPLDPRLTEDHLAGVRRYFLDLQGPAEFASSEMPEAVLDEALQRIGDIGDPLPAWTGIQPDASGRLWLERGECGAPSSDVSTFDIIDPVTGYVATVEIPGGLHLLSVRGRWVLANRIGDFDVERVELYELQY